MKSDLDQLLAILEDEKTSLELAIKEALTDHHYESVYQNGNALNKIRSHLYRLNSFKDPFYENEQRLKRYGGLSVKQSDPYMQLYWEEFVEKEQGKINELRLIRGTALIDSQEIDNAVFDLHEGKHQKFRLCLPHRSEYLQLDFALDNAHFLNISIDIKSIISDYDPDDPEENQLHLFENLGFRTDNENGIIVCRFNMNKFKDAWDIKILLSRIVYDIGYHGEDKQGTIELYD